MDESQYLEIFIDETRICTESYRRTSEYLLECRKEKIIKYNMPKRQYRKGEEK